MQLFRSRVRRPSNAGLEFQKLEPRHLLAGDVTVFIDNLQLFVIGDADANQIQIIGNLDGGARVVGLEGTTINGGTGEFAGGLGLRGASIQMNAGNDEVDVHAFRTNHTLLISGQGGDDRILVRNSSVGQMDLRGGGGNDTLQIENVFTVRTTNIDTGDGSDLIAVLSHAAGENIQIRAAAGNDTLTINQMGMYGAFHADMGSGNDQILFAGETWLGSESSINLGSGDDFLAVMPTQTGANSQIGQQTVIDGGAGNDLIALDARVAVGAGSSFDGNSGTDGLSQGGTDLSASNILRFENAGFDLNAALDSVYAAVSDAGLDPSLFGGTQAQAFDISVNTIPLNYPENSGAQSIDAALVLQGPADTIINTVVVTVVGFQAGEDSLSFTNTAEITGVFDDTSGVLTLTGETSIENYQAALRSVTFVNDSEDPSEEARSIRIQVTNSLSETLDATRDLNLIAVADAPELTVRSDTLVFDLDDPDLTRPVILDETLQLTDVDTRLFNSAVVRIVSGLEDGDQLNFRALQDITGNYDAATGLLTLSGTGNLATYQEALRAVTFDTTATPVILDTRTIQFEISDGLNNVSGQFDVVVRADQTLEVVATGDPQPFAEGSDATAVDDNFTIFADGNDPDAVLAGATVQVVSGYNPDQDQLSFTPVAGISGSVDETTGTLTFTGAASAADYQTLLRGVTYFNDNTGNDLAGGERVFRFSVEHSGVIAGASRSVDVIDRDEALIREYLADNGLVSQVTDSGLHYIVNQPGNGNFPNANSTVTVAYTGMLLDGSVFDSNDNGLTISLQSVIAGWTEGIPKFSVGGSGMLLIPSDLGYGEFGNGPDIPGNSVLLFDIELLDFV